MDADPNIANNYKETPVLIATGLGEKEILEELLKKGADPNIGAEPPILVASDLGFEDIADLLVIHGADLNKHDERGVMAFEVAEQRNFSDLAQKLNPQQFSSRTPRDVFKLTKKSLDSLQSHLNRGPLFLNPEAKPGVISSALRGLLQTLNVH
jgi:ankyrin repeat protein